MVRLTDLHPAEAEHMRKRAADMQPVSAAPWVTPKPLRDAKVAIVSTAGMHRRSDPPFNPGAVDYRLLPGDVDFADVVVSHISTNFDRSAFQEDPNIWFSLERLREMDAAGEIGGLARWHYSLWARSRITRHWRAPGKKSADCSRQTRSTSPCSFLSDPSARAPWAPSPTTSNVRAWPQRP